MTIPAHRGNDVAEAQVEFRALQLRGRSFQVGFGSGQVRLLDRELPRRRARYLLAMRGLRVDL